MKIAVVILNWNGIGLLKQFLPDVVKHSRGAATIYIADNASTDDSVVWAQAHYPDVKIIEHDKNYGFAEGYNLALEKIEADIFCLLNSDVAVTTHWLTPIVEIFERQPEVAVMQPKILDYKHPQKFEYAGAAGGLLDALGYPYCRGRIFEVLEVDKGQYNDQTEIAWAGGACFFVRSVVFKEVGGFDSHYFAYQEEIDLCWRIRNRNYKILYNGFSKVYHLGGGTMKSNNPRKTFYVFRNSLFTLTKNAPLKKLPFLLFLRLCLDFIAGIYFIVKGQFIHTVAIIKAHFSFYHYAKLIFGKREGAVLSHYYHTRSVVWQHFVKRKTHFRQL